MKLPRKLRRIIIFAVGLVLGWLAAGWYQG